MSAKIAKIDQLSQDENNANKGTERGQEMLENSLKNYGGGRSILLDKEGRIIAGNKTAQAATKAGMDEVIIVPTDGTTIVAVQRTDLDLENDPKAKQLAIADNRIGELDLSWDAQVVRMLHEDSPEVFDDYFQPGELNEILNGENQASGEFDNFQQALLSTSQGEKIAITLQFSGDEISQFREGLARHTKDWWGQILCDYLKKDLGLEEDYA